MDVLPLHLFAHPGTVILDVSVLDPNSVQARVCGQIYTGSVEE